MPETIDEAASGDDTAASSATQTTDNASAGSASADNQAGDPTASTSADAGSAVADNPSDDGNQAPSQGNTETEAAPQTQPTDSDRQYKAVQSWATKVRQENQELQRQLQELRQQVQASHQKSTPEVIPPHDERSPEHQDFLRFHDKADFYEELIQGEQDPAEIQKLQAKMHRVLGERGVKMLSDWRDDVRRQERERRLNPKAFYSKLIRQEAQPVVQETLQSTSQNYQQMIQARDEAQKWIQSNPEVATPQNIQAVIAMMEKGVKFDQASASVERDHYRNLVSNAKKMAASAEEKERLLQGNAAGAIHRNPNASRKVDVGKLRKDKGIQNGRQLIDELFDLDSKGML
jgi:hypothetical protein